MMGREGRRLRHELKYYIDYSEYLTLRSRIGAVLQRDKHAGPDGRYHIRSLYFDDFRNTALWDKLAGFAQRKKYRIRIYNLSDSFIKFERKNKFDDYISKESVTLTREEADRIIAGDVAFMYNSENRFLRSFYLEYRCNLLRPNVIVEYYREAYIHPVGNVRVTFDTDLHTGLYSVSLFDPQIFTMRAIDEPVVILEIKYDNVLPKHIRDMFPNTIRPRSAIGKFVISKKFTKYNEWEDM